MSTYHCGITNLKLKLWSPGGSVEFENKAKTITSLSRKLMTNIFCNVTIHPYMLIYLKKEY